MYASSLKQFVPIYIKLTSLTRYASALHESLGYPDPNIWHACVSCTIERTWHTDGKSETNNFKPLFDEQNQLMTRRVEYIRQN